MNKINTTAYQFIKSQIKDKKNKHGRRFFIDGKVLALSIYKQRPKEYKYLSSIFALPSLKCNKTLVHNVPFYPSFNAYHWKFKITNCETNSDGSVLYINIWWNVTGNRFTLRSTQRFGLKDLRDDKRHISLADHILTFMIRGLRKKFKQPICFYFVKRTIKTQDLVNCIKDIIKSIQSTKLDIVATVSDQGTTNVAAINSLKSETIQFYKSVTIENHYEGYLINDYEIIHIMTFHTF